MGTFPPPALRTRRADFRHRALQWNHAARTRACRLRPAGGSCEPWHPAHTLALAGRCVVRPVDALTTATARVVPFACACDDVWHSFQGCSSVGVIGRSATPGACSRSPSLPPEAPSLGSALPGFNGSTGFSATLAGPTLPSRVVGWRVPRHRQGFPCCVHSPLPHVPPPLPRRNRSVLPSLASRPLAAFPDIRAGRLPRCPFRGLLGVYSRCGPRAR